jgi:bifunctional DNase/RNase
VVEGDLDDEARRAPRLGERSHAEEDPAGLLVLGDRLQRFQVFEPQLVHDYPTPRATPRIRLGFRPACLSYIRAEVVRMQEMLIYGVSFDLVGKQPIVLLKTSDGNKFLPIWIGHPEAAAILMKLQSQTSVRPMTHDLVSDMLEQLGASISRITVTELRENTFYAQITVVQDGQEIEVDSRPSDAIALAIRAEAPIFAADDVIAESAIEFEGEEVDEEQLEAEVLKFRSFLEDVTPDQFVVENGDEEDS